MASKRKYVEYLWDPTCKMPTRSKYRMKQAAASADEGCANNETEDDSEPCTRDQGSRNWLEGTAEPRNVEPTSVQELLPTETEASEPRVPAVELLVSNATWGRNNDDSSDSSSDDTDAETEADRDDAAVMPGKEISDLVCKRVISLCDRLAGHFCEAESTCQGIFFSSSEQSVLNITRFTFIRGLQSLMAAPHAFNFMFKRPLWHT